MALCTLLFAVAAAWSQQAAPEVPIGGVRSSHFGSIQSAANQDQTGTYVVTPKVKTLLRALVVYNDQCEEVAVGQWTIDTQPKYGVTATGDVTGTLDNGACPGVKFTGAAVYYTWTSTNANAKTDTFNATYTGDQYTVPEKFDLTLANISLKRLSLMKVQATGVPKGGSFGYKVQNVTGTTNVLVAFAKGNSASTNPNDAQLSDPKNPSKRSQPSPGGLAQVTATYTVNKTPLTDTYKVPTFGMSCYYTTLESDWGSPPNCSSVTIFGVRYSGTVKNPPGLRGTYCSAFLAEIRLQGSGVLNSGQDLQYIGGTYTSVSSIKSSDGSAVVADETVARSRSIIPGIGVRLDVNDIGASLLANDTGGAITGYRLDYYRGAGAAVCSGFSNIEAVSACTPSQSKCPASAVK